MDREILQCDLHDYLEIACLYAITVELDLKDGTQLTGTPVTTRANSHIGEFLELKDHQAEQICSIPVLSIVSMRALAANPHFDKVVFSAD
ncbi:MAG: Rho-binding antiterminator [Pseudomonadota bacterium]